MLKLDPKADGLYLKWKPYIDKKQAVKIEEPEKKVRKRDKLKRFFQDQEENLSDPTGIGRKLKLAAYFLIGFLALAILIPILKLIL